MPNSGKVHYEVGRISTDRAMAMHRLVAKVALLEEIAERQIVEVHLPYHESNHLLNLAYNRAVEPVLTRPFGVPDSNNARAPNLLRLMR